MCAVIFPFIRRLFSFFVLTCFLWTTLFQTVAFANFEPVLFETRGERTFARFNLGIHKPERSASPTSKGGYTFDVDSASSPTDFVIPLSKTGDRAETQKLIDLSFAQSIYEKLTILQDGFSWTSYGVGFCLKNSGDLIVSRNHTHTHPSEDLHLSNPHGAIIFKDDLNFDHLTLSTHKVISEGVITARSLSLHGNLTYYNKRYLSVEQLYFDDTLCDPNDLSTLPQLINEGAFIAKDSAQMAGNGAFINTQTGIFEAHDTLSLLNRSFVNHGTFIAKKETTLALTKLFSNDNTVIFDQDVRTTGKFKLKNKVKTGVIPSSEAADDQIGIKIRGNVEFDDFNGEIENKSVFAARTMRGHVQQLANDGIFGVEAGFDLTIEHVNNTSTGRIVGDGKLTLGRTVNEGIFKSNDLVLGIADVFNNTGTLDVTQLATHGTGTFRQQGRFISKRASLNNSHFSNEKALYQPDLELSFGDKIQTFDNHKDIAFKTKTLHFAPSSTTNAIATNAGLIETEHFDNAISTFVNKRQLKTTRWDQRGITFNNALGGMVAVTDKTHMNTHTLNNRGGILFEGEIQGRVDHVSNKGDLVFHKKSTLKGQRFSSSKVMRTNGDFYWQGITFKNTGTLTALERFKLDAETFYNSGTFKSAKRITHNGKLLQNKGYLGSKSGITGTIESIDNTSEMISGKEIRFTGNAFTNSGSLKAIHAVSYNGQSFTSTEKAILQGKKLALKTTKPLVLRGMLQGEDGSTFSAPSIENEAQLNVTKGKTTFYGTLSNKGKIDVDELVYEGKTFTNSRTGIFEANQFKRVTKLTSLINHGIYVVRSGGFDAQILENKGSLELLEGIYSFDQWDNEKGNAVLDQLSLTSPDLVLDGKLDIGRFKSTRDLFRTINIKGKTIIRSGGFHTNTLTNSSSLALEKGYYRADLFKGHQKTNVKMHESAHLTVGEMDNEGEVISSVNLTVDASLSQTPLSARIQTVLETNMQRCMAFTLIPNAFIEEQNIKKEEIYHHTLSITDLLKDKTKVDKNRHATDEEKKSILQAVMGAEITAHIHNNESQTELTLSNQLPTLLIQDPLFRHFEILRLTEKLSQILVKKAKVLGYETLYSISDATYDVDNATLCEYSGLKKETFRLWFREIFEKHRDGFPLPKKPSLVEQVRSTRNSLITLANKITIDIFDYHTQRCTLFTSLQSVLPAEQNIKKEEIYRHTHSITDLHKDKTKVDKNRHATDEEKKAILQAVMGTEITAHIHSLEQQETLRLTSHLPTLHASDPLFRHFEILRLTEKLSRLLVQQVMERGHETLHCTSTDYDTDNKTLCDYSGLQKEMFLLWFKEIFEQHKTSFPAPKKATLTILGKSTNAISTKTPKNTPPKLGTIQTTHGLTLASHYFSTSSWISDFLKNNSKKLHIGSGDLFIETDFFSNFNELELPYHVRFKTKSFTNYKKIKINGLTFTNLHSFSNGITNDCMGLIECYGPMDVSVKYDFDNRFGVIKTTNKTKIKSERGSILNGAPKSVKETRDDTSLVFHNYAECTVDAFIKNGAKITSPDDIEFRAPNGDINTSFGSLYGKSLHFATKKKLLNKSGDIVSAFDIFFDVDELENTVGDIDTFQGHADSKYHHYDHGRGNWGETRLTLQRSRQYVKSGSAIIQSLNGNIYFKVRSGKNFGSKVLSPHVIKYYSNGNYTDVRPESFLHNDAPLTVHVPDVSRVGGFIRFFGGTPHGSDHISLPSIPAIFQAGEYIDIRAGDVNLSGSMNAPKISLDMGSFLSKATGRTSTIPTSKITIDLWEVAQNAMGKSSLLRNLIEQGGGLALDILGAESPLPGDLDTLPLIPHASYHGTDVPPLLFSPDAMRFTMMHALSQYLNTLNVRGTSGDDFLYHVLHPKKSKKEMTKDGQLITTEDRSSVFNEGTLFMIIKQIGEQFYRVPQMIAELDMFNPHPDANLSGHEIDVLVRGKTNLDKTVIAAYAPTTPQQKTKRSVALPKELLSEITIDTSPMEHIHQFVSGIIKEEEKAAITFTSLDDMDAKSARFHSHKGVNLDIHGNASLESTVDTIQRPDGFHQVVNPFVMDIKGAVTVKTRQNLLLRAIEVTSDTRILFEATGKIFDLDLALAYARSYTEHNKDGIVYVTEQGSNAVTSKYTAPESVTFRSKSSIDAYAPTITSRDINYIAENGVTIHDVHDFYTCSTQQQVQGKGLFGKDKEIQTQYYSERSKGAVFNGKLKIKTTEGDVALTNITASDVTIEAINGVVEFRQGVNVEQFSRSEKTTSLLWQSQQSYQEKTQDYTASNISGKIKVISKSTIVEVVRGQTVDFLTRIEQDGGVITQRLLDEIHDIQSKKVEGPTAAYAAVISLAATLATGGAAAPGLMAAMQAAAVGSLAGQAAVHLVACQGDIGMAAKRLASTDTFRNIAVAVATAGITKALAGHFNISTAPNTLGSHAQYQGLKAGVDAGIGLAVDGEISLDHLARGFTAGVIGGCLANHIGAAYGKTHIDGITHKIMHATAGAFTGIILDSTGDPMAGAAAGALGAFVAETFADMFKPDKPVFKTLEAREEELGRPLNETEFKEFYQAEMQAREAYDTSVNRTAAFSKLTAATTALFAGQDVTVAMSTSATAIDNNFLILAYAGITVASVGYAAYDVYQTYENEGPEAALIKLGVDATLFAVGGLAVKGGSVLVRKAVAEILAKNPSLRMALGSLVETMLVSAEKVMATSAGQKVAAGVAKMEAPLVKSIDRASEAFDKLRGKVSGKTTSAAKSAPKIPRELKVYVREVESKSGLPVHPSQRELLAADLRQNAYTKLQGAELKAHQNQFTKTTKDRLITEWEHHTGRTWPKYDRDIINLETGKIARHKGWKYDAHHVNPQELGGKNAWWNMHPVPCPEHQRFVHGVDSQLSQIIKGVSKNDF